MTTRIDTMRQLTIALDRWTMSWVQEEAEATGQSLSEVVRRCCQERVLQQENDPRLPMTVGQLKQMFMPMLKAILVSLFSQEGLAVTQYMPAAESEVRNKELKYIDTKANAIADDLLSHFTRKYPDPFADQS